MGHGEIENTRGRIVSLRDEKTNSDSDMFEILQKQPSKCCMFEFVTQKADLC